MAHESEDKTIESKMSLTELLLAEGYLNRRFAPMWGEEETKVMTTIQKAAFDRLQSIQSEINKRLNIE